MSSVHHIALVVREPEKTAALLQSLFHIAPTRTSGVMAGPSEILVDLGGVWLVLARGNPPERSTLDHIAITVPGADLGIFEQRLADLGLRSQRSRTGTRAEAVYFLDFDNHMFEISSGDFGFSGEKI